MAFYVPPSMAQISVIRSRARVDLEDMYSHVRTAKKLEGGEYCDPRDPCCGRKDAELFLNTSFEEEDQLVDKKACPPKNPHHFEYTILHRLKLRRLFQLAVERQNNNELTEEQLAEITRLEEEVYNERAQAAPPPLGFDLPPGVPVELLARKQLLRSICQEGPQKKEKVSRPPSDIEGKVITARTGGRKESVPPLEQKNTTGKGRASEEMDMDVIVRAIADLKEPEENEYRRVSSPRKDEESGFEPESVLDKLIRNIARPAPILDVLGLKIHVPRKSRKPLWNKILGTMKKGEEIKGRHRYAQMISLTRHFEEQPLPQVTFPKTAKHLKGDRGTPVNTAKSMALPDVVAKPMMLAKSDAPQMPATSDIPMSGLGLQSTNVRVKKQNSKKHAGLAMLKFPMAPAPSRHTPPPKLHRRSIYMLSTVDY